MAAGHGVYKYTPVCPPPRSGQLPRQRLALPHQAVQFGTRDTVNRMRFEKIWVNARRRSALEADTDRRVRSTTSFVRSCWISPSKQANDLSLPRSCLSFSRLCGNFSIRMNYMGTSPFRSQLFAGACGDCYTCQSCGQNFDGYFTVEFGITRTVDLALCLRHQWGRG